MDRRRDMTSNGRRVAIITGGSQGIGAGLVAGYRGRGLGGGGQRPHDHGRREDPDVLAVEGDIAKPATAERIVDGALERFGRIDTLVNNAGVFISKPFTDYTAGRLRPGHRRQPRPGSSGSPSAPSPRWRPGTAATWSTSRPPWPRSRTPASPSVAGRADQGRPGRGHPVTGGRVRLPRHPGQRRLARHHPDAGAPGGKLRGARRPASPARARRARSATSWTRILFLESSPYITGEILHVDGGQTAGALRSGQLVLPAGEDLQEEQEHVQDVEEDRRGQQRRGVGCPSRAAAAGNRTS